MLLQVKEEAKAKALKEAKFNKGLSHAANILKESTLATRCPNLVKGLESADKDTKYKTASLIQLLENTANYISQYNPEYANKNLLKEDATTLAGSLLSPGVASLTPAVIDIVNVFYPNMVLHHFFDVQAMDRQTGNIFTIKTIYSDNAATVQAGDIVFEEATDGSYASEKIAYAPATIAASVSVTAPTFPTDATVKLRAGSFKVILNGRTIARDYGNATESANGVETVAYTVIGRGITGTVDPQTGAATLSFDATIYAEEITAGAELKFEGSVDTETDKSLIRKIQFMVPNTSVTAQEHPLMSTYSVASGLVMNAHLAIDVDELVRNQLAGTIRWERDLAAVKMAYDSAALDSRLDFDCAANGANLTLAQRYSSFKTTVASARGIIQANAGRGTVDAIIVSTTQGLPIVESIESFRAAPEAKKPIGPYLAGTLNEGTIAVIAVPYSKSLPEDQVVFCFKGFQVGDSALICGEWVPLYFTPTWQAPSLRNHVGALSFYDLVVNKKEYLVRGTISNFNVA